MATVAIGLRLRSGRGLPGPTRDPAASIQVEKVTSRGNVKEAAISPDGRYLAYSSPEKDGLAIWLRDLVEKTETRLATSEGEYTDIVRFARDGQAVYYSVPTPKERRAKPVPRAVDRR